MMKKMLTVLLSVALLVTVAFSVAACKKTETDPDAPIDRTEEQEQPSLTLDQTSLTLVVGDAQKLIATLANAGGGEEIAFTSDNLSVATVSTDGVVTAVAPGTATVTAAAGTLSATAAVTVNLGGDLPRLTFAGGVESAYAWNVGETFEFTPQVTLGTDKTFTDVSVTFRSSDEAVLSFDGNKAEPKKKGSVTVSVSAVWRGMDAQTYETLALSFPAAVRDRATFTVNGDTPQDVNLYTVASVSGYEGAFDVSVPYVPALEFNGEQKTPSCTVADTTVADVVDGRLVAKGRGTTTLTLSYDTGDDVYSLPPITVTVLRPTVEVADPVTNFCNSVGGYKDENADYAVKTLDTLLAGGGTLTLVDAFQGEKALTVTDNAVRGLDLDLDRPTQTEITVGTETVCYRFSHVVAYGDILSTVADLNQFNRTAAGNEKPLIGYFVLAKDIVSYIDFSCNKSWTDISKDHGLAENTLSTNYFQGTLDGQGHTISGLEDRQGKIGFFGAIADNSTIKNIAFVNCNSPQTGKVFASFIGNNVTVQNVYIQTKAITGTPRGVLAHRVGSNFKVENVIVDIASLSATWNSSNNMPSGLLFGGESYLWQGNRNSVTNTYIFGANYPIAAGYMNQGIAYAGNETDATWEYGNDTITATQHSFAGVKRYDTKADMIADKDNDFADFRDGGYWHIADGIPVWGAGTNAYTVYIGDTVVTDAFAAFKDVPNTVTARLWGDAQVTLISSDTTKLSVDNENHTFTLLDNAGATLTVQVGETTVATVAVTLRREVERYAETVPYFAADIGKWKDPNDNFNAKTLQSLLTNPPAFTGALQDGNPVTLAPDGSLSGLTLSAFEMNETVITLQTEDKDYEFVVEAYHGVLSTAADLNQFNRTAAANENKPLIGYFVLAKDISGYFDFSFNGNWTDVGMNENTLGANYFQGTFDGQGHTIRGFEDRQGKIGFFGAIADNSTIKNVAFTNCSTTQRGKVFATYIGDNVTVQNVYIQTQALTGTPRGVLAHRVGSNFKVENVIVDIASLSIAWNSSNDMPSGLLFGGEGDKWHSKGTNVENTYVFGAKYPIAAGYMKQGIAYAGNETDSTWTYGNGTTTAPQRSFAGVKRYDTKDAMIADASKNNFASFTAGGYWHIEDGIPVWGAAA